MRGERSIWQGITILNDSYNSNPEAARNMVDILCAEPAKRKIAVLGEMLELGHMAEQLHRDLGRYAVRAGVNVLIGVQGAAQFTVDEALKVGLAAEAAFFFPESERAGKFLRKIAEPGDAILLKGSRGAHLEIALQTLIQDMQDKKP
jgi:UDP-N-acetylmuramoyl-tripeptide--D-alanyl-D-alanine ligase